MATSDFSTEELNLARLRLRDDLMFTPQKYRNRIYYHIESGGTGRFFRIGIPEYTFISLLDGDTTVATALSLTARVLGPDAFREHEAASICRWLVESGLAINQSAERRSDMQRATLPNQPNKLWQRLNPFWMKFPMGNPDAILKPASDALGWVFSVPAMIVWSLVCLIGFAIVCSDWNRFTASTTEVLSVSNWLWLGITWVVLKLIHEAAHGLACRRHDGEVRETGIIFILFAPMAYVDLTSAWRFPSKWHRFETTIAGMYTELFIAACAAIVWSQTTSPEISYHLVNIIVLASVTTLVFNANPLMRFDGYFALSDLTELPNLYADGQKAVRRMVRSWFVGREPTMNSHSGATAAFVNVYGIAAAIWKVVICLSLMIGAATLFHGAGLALAVIGVVSWLAIPLYKAAQTLVKDCQRDPTRKLRIGLSTAGTVLVIAGALVFLPWPGSRSAPAIVEYDPLTVIRADAPGFVEQILVQDGQLVTLGQTLLTLRNEQVRAELQQLTYSIEESVAQQRVHMQNEDFAAAQVEAQKRRSLQSQLTEKQVEVESLTVRAKAAGRLSARDLDSRVGSWLEQGDEVATIGVESSKEVILAIAQQDIDSYRAGAREPVQVHLPGRVAITGHISRLTPRARLEPPNKALCGPAGGYLSVQVVESEEDGDERWQMLTPRFTGHVALGESDSRKLPAGQTGLVTLGSDSRSLGMGLYDSTSRWFNSTAVAMGLR